MSDLHTKMSSVLGYDPNERYPVQWEQFVGEPTHKSLATFLNAVDIKGRVAKQAHQALIELMASANASNKVPHAVRIHRPKQTSLTWDDLQKARPELSNLTPFQLLGDVLRDVPPMGVVTGNYDEALQTNIYHIVSPTTTIVATGFDHIPTTSETVVIWFHGAGSINSNGSVFWMEMNALADHGVASVSMDLPFHGNGPRGSEFKQMSVVMDWIDQIVSRYKNQGKQVVLAGHSFGPQPILEYLARKNHKADGAILFAPGRYSPGMVAHYRTGAMRFLDTHYAAGGDIYHIEGDQFEEAFIAQTTFMNQPAPTVPLLSVLGEHDEWTPDSTEVYNLASHYPSMKSVVLPGVGHNLFGLRFGDLPHYVQGELFAGSVPPQNTRISVASVLSFLKENLEDLVNLEPDKRESLSVRHQAILLYRSNPSFAAIVGEERLLYSEQGARVAFEKWEKVKTEVRQMFLSEIPNLYPAFYSDDVVIQNRRGKTLGTAKKILDQILATPAKKRKRVMSQEDMLLSNLRRFIETSEQTQMQYGFGVPKQGVFGETVENQWSRYLEDRLLVARMSADGWYKRGVGPESFRGGGISSQVILAFERMLQKLDDTLRIDLKVDTILQDRLLLLNALKEQLGLEAKTVLSVGEMGDLASPFKLFTGTDRVIVLSNNPFGMPDKMEKAFSRSQIESVRIGNALGSEYRNLTGGDYLSVLMEGVSAERILGVYYFVLDNNGNKVLVNPEEEVDFANAEVVFLDADGNQKILEVHHANITDLNKRQCKYLARSGVQGIYAGADAAELETHPEMLSYYYDLLTRTKNPLVTRNRRKLYVEPYSTMQESPRLVSYLDSDKVQTYGSGRAQVHVAPTQAFRSEWRYRDTWQGVKEGFKVQTTAMLDTSPDLERPGRLSAHNPCVSQHSESWLNDEVITLRNSSTGGPTTLPPSPLSSMSDNTILGSQSSMMSALSFSMPTMPIGVF